MDPLEYYAFEMDVFKQELKTGQIRTAQISETPQGGEIFTGVCGSSYVLLKRELLEE